MTLITAYCVELTSIFSLGGDAHDEEGLYKQLMFKQTPVTVPKEGICLGSFLVPEEQFDAKFNSQLSQSLAPSSRSFSRDGKNSMEDGNCLYLLSLRFNCRKDSRG